MPNWLTPQLLVGILCGGLGGAVFTWLRTGDPKARVGYNITTIKTGFDVSYRSVVPDLVIRIGDREVEGIYTHCVELVVLNGYSPQCSLGIMLDPEAELFGREFVPPTPLHVMKPDKIKEGYKCQLGPL